MLRYLTLFFTVFMISLDASASCTQDASKFSPTQNCDGQEAWCLDKMSSYEPVDQRPMFYCRITANCANAYMYRCTSYDDCPDGMTCGSGNDNSYCNSPEIPKALNECQSCPPGTHYEGSGPDYSCVPIPPDPEECFAENKLYDPLTEQCAEECEVGYQAGYERCTFVGCPNGYYRYGTKCLIGDTVECTAPDITVCNASDCWCDPVEENGCNPSHPQYVGTSFDGRYLCDQPPPSCGGVKVGYVTYTKDGVSETVMVCVSADDDPTGIDPVCTGGKVNIDGGCQYPPNYDHESTVIGQKQNSDGTTTSTTTTKTTSTNSSGGQQTTTTTITQTFDADGNLVSESSSEQVSDEGSESVVRGSGDCSDMPTCINADAVDCAILQQIWLQRCDSNDESNGDFDSDSFAASELGNAESDADAFGSQLQGMISDITPSESNDDLVDFSEFTVNYTPQSGNCPSDITIDLDIFPSVTFPISTFCSQLSMIAAAIRILASFSAFLMVFNTIREL